MSLKQIYSIIAIILIISLVSCEDEVKMLDINEGSGQEYYPLEVGNFWTYRVDSTVISNERLFMENSLSFVREEIVDMSIVNQDTFYTLHRFESSVPTGGFVIKDAWRIEKSNSRLVRVEENLSFLKMLFPLNVGTQWDGNLFDEFIPVIVANESMEVFREWDYEVLDQNPTAQFNNTTYDDVFVIQQADFESDLELRKSTEIYAPNVGMIRREVEIWDTQRFGPDFVNLPWVEKAELGFSVIQTLIDHN